MKITVNLSALDKSKIKERTFVQAGRSVTIKEYSMEILPLKQEKLLKEGPTWELVKTHIVCDVKPRGDTQRSKILGDGITIRDKDNRNIKQEDPFEKLNADSYVDDEMIDLDKIPF